MFLIRLQALLQLVQIDLNEQGSLIQGHMTGIMIAYSR